MALDNVVEQVFADPSELAIDSTRGSFNECPRPLLKVWNIDVVVVQVSDGNCILNVNSLPWQY